MQYNEQGKLQKNGGIHPMAKKALIIEDDANIRELMRLYLEKDGFEVYGAADGGNGLREFKRVEPDIVLLDIMLPC